MRKTQAARSRKPTLSARLKVAESERDEARQELRETQVELRTVHEDLVSSGRELRNKEAQLRETRVSIAGFALQCEHDKTTIARLNLLVSGREQEIAALRDLLRSTPTQQDYNDAAKALARVTISLLEIID